MTAFELRTDRARVLALLRRWGWNATGFQVLERGFSHFFDGDDACVAYYDTGQAWVVAGAPIAPAWRFREVTKNFVDLAGRMGRRVSFFGGERRFVDAVGLPSLLVGEQAIWNPQDWAAALGERRSLRQQLGRARAKGVRVRAVAPAELCDPSSPRRRAVEELVARWLGTRRLPQMGFLVDVQLFEFAEERRYFLAERGDEVVGLLSAVPVFARSGWLFEDLLRDPNAPNGTTELLVDQAMRAVAAEGSRYATLGLAPLSGPVAPVLRQIRHWSRPLYDFEGLRAYKSKFAPQAWDPILLAYPENSNAALALYDSLAAFARGSLLGFGVRALRGALRPHRGGKLEKLRALALD